MHRRLGVVVCLLLSVVAARGRAEEIFSSFGPGMTTQNPPGEGQGGACLSAEDFPTWRVAWSTRFTPQVSSAFTRAQLALLAEVPQGTASSAVLMLQEDANGLPGAVLETITVENLTSSARLHTVASRRFPQLRAGASYWLSLLAAPNSVTCWLLSPLCGESGPACWPGLASLDYDPTGYPADVYPWIAADDVLARPAIRVEGDGAATVRLDVMPGSPQNALNPRSRGVIPVAVMSSEAFDPATIDPKTVRFGRKGSEAAPVHVSLENLDGDGYVDLVLHFRTQETGIACGDTSAILTGATVSGERVRGGDAIRTVGCK